MQLHDATIKQLQEKKHLSVMANCHIHGLFSIVLDERESPLRGMRRIFFAGPDCDMASLHKIHPDREVQKDFSILPHNHRQDISLHHLCGHTTNVNLHFSGNPLNPVPGRGDRVTEFIFGSALLGSEDRRFTLEPRTKMLTVDRYEFKRLTPGGVFLPWSVVHTVKAEPNSAWLVVEGKQAGPNYKSLCYSTNSELSLSSYGLYEVLSKGEGHTVVEQLVSLIEGRGTKFDLPKRPKKLGLREKPKKSVREKDGGTPVG